MDPVVDAVGVRLQEALNLRELVNTSVTTFTVAPPDSDDELDDGGKCNYFNKEELITDLKLDFLDGGDGADPSENPFERLSSRMTNVTNCGKVRKQVLRAGEGMLVPENSVVVVHYNAFIEHFDEPFDSTYLRGKPDKFSLSSEAVIPGLLIGLKTMRKKEKANFLIHPDMAFGKLGCPPRIPANAEVLFEVEMLSYLEDPGVAPDDDDPKQEKTFADYYKAAQIYNLQGNEEFMRGNTQAAVDKYRQATKILERTRLQNEEEEERYKNLLFRLYTNLAVCHNKLCRPYKVLDICKRAYDIGDDKKGKLYFNHGKALLTIGDFDRALQFLKKANKLAPNDEAVNREMKKLSEMKRKYAADEKSMLKRFFGSFSNSDTDNQPRPTTVEVTDGFAATVRSILRELQTTEKNSLVLPKGLTKTEECFINSEAVRLNMKISISNKGGQKTVSIVKEASSTD